MSRPQPEILLTDAPLERPTARFSAEAGGVVEFYGVVRGQEGPDAIDGIDYEAYREMAEHQLGRVADEACERFSLLSLTLHHRIGFVPVAEPSLFLRVGAGHRGPAFEAAEWVVVQLKLRVPIWKHPVAARQMAISPNAPVATA